MTQLDIRTVPADEHSRASMSAGGFDYGVVDGEDSAQLGRVFRAIFRGFAIDEPNDEVLAAGIRNFDGSRVVAVRDSAGPAESLPVGTAESWITPLTVPGGELPMWATTGVTVAATHRRRGIATAVVEGELRAAAAAGVPVAGLTVSEATIYGRYGYGPATRVCTWTIDARRAGWIGPDPDGALRFLDPQALTSALSEVHERSRLARVGDLGGLARRWRQLAGSGPEERHHAAAVRGVGYFDAAGALRGAMAYRIVASETDWTRSRLEIRHLVGETPDARAALWRFALQHDLIGTITASMRPVDDPLPWMVADVLALETAAHDHGWLRLLDLPRAFEARSFAAPLSLVMRVADRLGFAEGCWRLETDASGACTVTPVPQAEPDVVIGVSELSSIYLGGASPLALAEAGRIRGTADRIAALDAALRVARAPHLSYGF